MPKSKNTVSTMQGRDLSRSNTDEHLQEALTTDFVIVKATEGNGHPEDPDCVDPKHNSFVKAAREAGLLVGHYHVCHPENNPIDEAAWFVKYAKLQPGDITAADLETADYSDMDSWDWGGVLEWMLKFLAHVRLLSGSTPLVYLNTDIGNRLLKNADPRQRAMLIQVYGLWKAQPDSDDIGETFGFRFVLIWQYDWTEIDKDVFRGDREAWQAIAVPQKEADMAMKGPQYDGYPVFGYPKLCNTDQIEGFAQEVLTLPHPDGTSIHLLEYDVISDVHNSKNSWHYWFDNNHALACDVNLYGTTDAEEFAWLRDFVAPVAKKWGLAITCPIDSGGYGVPGHSIGDGLHLHVDVGSWSNTGIGNDRFAPWNKKLNQLPDVGDSSAVIKLGDRGDQVKAVQRKVGVPRDGVFGPVTERGVKRLQRRLNFVNQHNLKVDGEWGPNTDEAYDTFCDGKFGGKTIRLWQRNAHTTVDGVISTPSRLIEKVQREDSKSASVRDRYKLTGREIDGVLGPKTWKMIQDLMGFDGRQIDGIPGEHTVTRLQQRLLRGRM